MSRLTRRLADPSPAVDPDRLAARLDGVDGPADGILPPSEERLLRLAAELRMLGADAPTLTDRAAMRRVMLARTAATRARSRRRGLAIAFAAPLVLLTVGATVTASQWVPTVGSVLGPLVDGLWGEPHRDVAPGPTPRVPPDADPSGDPGKAPSFAPSPTPAEPAVQPSPEPGGPVAPPTLVPPGPPEATPTMQPIPPPDSPPASLPVGSPPIPTPPVEPPIPSPSQPPLPRAPGG